MESDLGPSAGPGERPGAGPPAVESGLGPSSSRGERPGAVRRPWRAAWGRPPAVESGLGPSAGHGDTNQQAIIEASLKQAIAVVPNVTGITINVVLVNGNNTMNF